MRFIRLSGSPGHDYHVNTRFIVRFYKDTQPEKERSPWRKHSQTVVLIQEGDVVEYLYSSNTVDEIAAKIGS